MGSAPVIRAVRAAGSVLAAIAVVAGPPVVAGFAVLHWSPRLPPLGELVDGGPPSLGQIVVLAAIPIALLWLVASGYLLRGGVRRARAQLRMPSPVQLTAGSMAGAVVLGAPAVVAVVAPAAPAVAASSAGEVVASGVELPDGAGWVPVAVGQAVATTAAAFWLRRRREYRPLSPGSDVHPLPVTVNVLTAVRTDGGSAVPLVEHVPPGGVTLSGPGARDALRGLLISLLLAGRRVVVSWADLGELLEDPYLSGPVPAGLRAVDELTDSGADEVALTVCATPGTGTWVALGADAAASRWEVGADGTIAGVRRLCVLNARAAADLFGLLTAVRPEEAPAQSRPRPRPAAARLRLLGGCELTVGGHPVIVRRSAGLQVLAYLGVHPGGATAHEIIVAIWPGLRPATITNRLYITVSELKKDFLLGTQVELIRHEHGRYRLTEAVDVDVRHLQAAIAGVQRAITTAERRRAQQVVVDGYAGEVAAGCEWPWIVPAREALRRAVLSGYVDLAEGAEPGVAVELLRAAMVVEPHNALVRERAIAVLSELGDEAAVRALQQ
ncbi:AfsR/SARP family transcriptional regulator [Actinoplanes awajinensis]|uniref:AfsR/SARP family transcriptional regulator n=1 Tax=Actinoplanes awajinensis TaxID=135946 RepID=UPI0012F8E852|nr:hypothetical protein [Actinoplanes awajinensis]